MRTTAGFHAGRKLLEELQNRRSSQPAANHRLAGRVNCVDLEQMFGQINADRTNVPGGRLLFSMLDSASLAHRCRKEGTVHLITSANTLTGSEFPLAGRYLEFPGGGRTFMFIGRPAFRRLWSLRSGL